MTVTAQIDISTPTGKKIVRELENHSRVVKLVYNNELPDGAITLESAIQKVWSQLETKMGYDIRDVQK
jgi:hypothetical protein